MEVFLGILVTLLGFYTVIVSYKLKDSKSTVSLLQELNTKLESQVNELTSKNSSLWFELQQEKSCIDKGRNQNERWKNTGRSNLNSIYKADSNLNKRRAIK